jgi:hypothetical protein
MVFENLWFFIQISSQVLDTILKQGHDSKTSTTFWFFTVACNGRPRRGWQLARQLEAPHWAAGQLSPIIRIPSGVAADRHAG